MTVLSLAFAVVVWAASVAAVRRICDAKGRDSGALSVGALLFPPGALLGAALWQPVDPTQDRLAWWSASQPARAWAVVSGVLIAAAVAFGIYTVTRPVTLDGSTLNGQIEQWFARNGAPGASVHCPDYKASAGYTFICSATDTTGAAHVEVTVLNGQGDVKWQVTG